jgi:GT2 family glycosyltransferase
METIEPATIGSELIERDEETGGEEPVQIAPPVVAVVVTHNPGPWLEETLGAFNDQDYPALGVLVLDNASREDPTPRIAAAMPRAFIRRRTEEGDTGFGAAANDALAAVEGATFLLFCHDDVAPDPDAVRILVEEAYRSNAGIVGPKVVDHDHPELLLEVGMAVDHYGVPFSGIEPDEVDQEQHDGVRDVFFVSHAAMLVRADLFNELEGFDPDAFPGADDVDLCWRARLAGARVIVAPNARVRHRQSTVVEERPTHRSKPVEIGAATSSRVRVLYKSYSALALVWVLPVSFALALGEALGLLLTGHGKRGAAVIGGWFSAFKHPGELRRARAATQQLRRVDDGDVRDLMVRGSARLRTFMTQRVHASERLATASTMTRTRVDEATSQLRRAPAMIAAALAFLFVLGSRTLFFGRVPAVGWFQAWPSAGSAWSTFTAAWRTTMMGAPRAASPVFGLMALLDVATFGHPALAQTLVIVLALPIGAWGVYRLVRPMASSALPPVAAVVAYGANPLARNAVAHGALGPLVCFALAPYLLSAIARASATEAGLRARIHATLAAALLLAVITAAWPPALFLALAMALAFLLAWPFTGDARAVGWCVAAAAAATAIGALLLAPWSFTLIGSDPATRGLLARGSLSLSAVLRFDTGPAHAGIAGWGLLAAATAPLFIATGARFAWAARAWMMALISFALVWLPGRFAATAAVPAAEGALVLAGLGLALAVGVGVAAVLDDLPRFRFGWRQILTIVITAGLGLAMIGLAVDTTTGRWNVPANDWATTYAWMQDQRGAGDFRVLYLGDPTILPADGKVVSTVGYALTRNGPGDARALWAAPQSSVDQRVGRAIQEARNGDTSRLGHLLAPTGIRFVALISRAGSGGGAAGTPDPQLADALVRQLDLTLSRTDPSGVVYQNDAWVPMHAVVGSGNNLAGVNGTGDNGSLLTDNRVARGVAVTDGHTTPIGPGTLLWSEAANGGWKASANGTSAPRSDAFGATNAFTLTSHAPVTVHFHSSSAWLLHLLELLGWLIVVIAFVVTRRRRSERAV